MGLKPDYISDSLMPHVNTFGQAIGRPIVDFALCSKLPDENLVGHYARVSPLKESDLSQLFDTLNADAASWTYMPHGPFKDLPEFTKIIDDYNHNKGFQTFVIRDKDADAPLGMASYMRYDLTNGTVEVGFVSFSNKLRRSRIATDAMYLMMKHAFDHGFRRYEWKCDQLNTPSVQAALRLGFSFEGVFRNAIVYKGRRRDTAWFSVIIEDWPKVQKRLELWLDPSNFEADGQQKSSLSTLGIVDV